MNHVNKKFLLSVLNPYHRGFVERFANFNVHCDWEAMIAYAREHKVLGILIHRLTTEGLAGELARPIQEAFRDFQREANVKARQCGLTLRQIHHSFQRAGIPYLVFKGVVFVDELYEHAEVRPYFDLDLIVGRHHLDTADRVLMNLGYRFFCPMVSSMSFIPLGRTPRHSQGLRFDEALTRRLYQQYHYHYAYGLPKEDPRAHIDLHWELVYRDVLKVDGAGLLRYARKKAIGNIFFKTLTIEASVVYVATRIMLCGPESFKLVKYCDFMRLLMRCEDAERLWEVAREWGGERYLDFALRLVQRLFDFDVSPFQRSHGFVGRAYSNFCFQLGTHKFLLLEPSTRGIYLKKFMCSLFWDLGIRRLPRRSMRGFIRMVLQFLRAKVIVFNAAQ